MKKLFYSMQFSKILAFNKFLFILLIFFYSQSFSQNGWVWQNPLYSGEFVNSLFFFQGTTTGWAAGNGGLLMKTTNNGTTWQVQEQITTNNIGKIFFTNFQTGWFTCLTNTVPGGTFRTTDGGVHWTKVYPSGFDNFFFIDGNTGWLPARPNYILKTTDGGATFAFNNIAFYPECLQFINYQTGFVCGFNLSPSYGSMMKSTNGGANWFQIGSTFNNKRFLKLQFFNEFSGLILDNNNSLFKTTDGGQNWDSVITNLIGTPVEFKFLNMNTGYLTTDEYCYKTTNGGLNWSAIYHSTDTYNNSIITSFHSNNDSCFIYTKRAQLHRTYNSGANWQSLYGENNWHLQDVNFFDANTGMAVGENGSVFKTSNSGIEWIYNSAGSAFFTSVIMTDNQTAWTAGKGALYKTTNFGVNWISKSIPFYNLKTICITNSQTAWLLGDSVFKSTNGGDNWSFVMAPNYTTDYIQFVDMQTGWIGGANYMLKTTNGGNNWFEQYDAGGTTEKGIYFVNAQTGWAFFYSNIVSYLYKTTNGGNNWNDYIPSVSGYPYYNTIRFTDEMNGKILANGKFYRTTNGGVNWSNYSISSNVLFNSMDFPNAQTGWIVGNNGSIKRNIYGGVYVNNESKLTPEKFELFQNYPNPFNPVTKIKFKISEYSLVTLKVYDNCGREVETLVNNFLKAGIYETQFPGNTNLNLASGIYFYKLTAGDYNEVKKMVLLK